MKYYSKYIIHICIEKALSIAYMKKISNMGGLAHQTLSFTKLAKKLTATKTVRDTTWIFELEDNNGVLGLHLVLLPIGGGRGGVCGGGVLPLQENPCCAQGV